jgi:hypothetical protein
MKVLTAGLCALFLAFAAARAVRVPLTYDEAAAYLRYVDTEAPSVFNTSVLSVFSFEVATNHFLNTLLTKAAYLVAGNSEVVLRVPNLIGYAMYIGFSCLILFAATRPAVAVAGCMLLNLNPYLLDFFAMSRGYGLSLGFLMGALFFLFRFLARLRAGDDVTRELSRALLFACGAVLANFALLNVYLSLFGVLLVARTVFNSTTGASLTASAAPETAAFRRRSFPWLPLVATVFTALVLSQDAGLSRALYEPVSVRLLGLDPTELDMVRVTGTDMRGRERRLPRGAGATAWQLARPDPVRSLRIELPTAQADRIVRLEVIIGTHSLSQEVGHATAWRQHDEAGKRVFESGPTLSTPKSRLPEFRPLVNWAGDGRHAGYVAAYTACALSLLGGFALLLKGLAWLAVRTGILTSEQWRPLASGALWVTALVGAPLYLLKRDGQLYFGGTRGIVEDTFYSIIDDSFYGRTYHAAQTRIVFACLLVSVGAFCVVLYGHYRRRTLPAMAPVVSVLAILVLASLSVVAQRYMFHTVYLLGRTALFYIPLYMLFVALLCERIVELGQAGKALATAILAVAVTASTCHFMATANTKSTWDWLSDASTKQMMDDLGQTVAGERGSGSHVVLGVDWMYNPVAVYYAHKNTAAAIDVVALPFSGGIDFLYLDEKNVAPAMRVIRRFPLSRTALVKLGP